MDKQVCEKFQEVRNSISDELKGNGIPEFDDDDILNNYCDSKKCISDYDRISAGCLYLLYQFYNDSGIFPSPKNNNRYIVDYILIWLSYMLNLNKSERDDSIKSFYNYQIDSCDKYKTQINNLAGYDNYKELIDERKYLLDMDSNIVSKFYQALKLLCNLYNELGNNKNCKNYLNDDNEFFKKYEKLKNDSDITGNELYNQLLSTLLNDYNNFKTECNVILSPPPEETKQNHGQTLVHSSEQDVDYLGQHYGEYVDNSDAASSSSIASKLIPVLLIFAAIPIFLGIAYKYSLFGFRKRAQKQHLRNKLKK
ncbi:uncharacterized protein PY17X_0845201 [Plasmodium yoelii]|uniref:PIR protein n=3 Tax=Plasmodium yoelii TaxID=5861 RepID=A0AAE9WUV5_PLAYO|nr:uncharacterized protein PY17X_0845201 [Plasmodium yoelii]WBY57019.1 PIR protein [Plasmodium yoelii yoelii]VTZ77902.1 PIR protein [Plasmodium yoelii]|eukprot:XP_726164.3 uncharacterized protein PY17X_0845201 [Plasmodium yoelii]